MRTGPFILSFLFVILTIQPMVTKWNNVSTDRNVACTNNIQPAKILPQAGCCKKNVAKKYSSKKQEKQEPGNNPCNTCNPFMPCNACGYMPGETVELVSPIILGNGENTIPPDDFIISTYETECWHPPELFTIL